MHRVVFVCTGNICRSPAAHAVLAAALARDGPAGVEVDSAGTGFWHRGELPDPRARLEGARRGYDLNHRARAVTRADFAPGTLVLAMDRGHLRSLTRLAPPGFTDLRLFRSFDPEGGADADVADPYYGGARDFGEMYDVIERTTPAILAFLRSRVDTPAR